MAQRHVRMPEFCPAEILYRAGSQQHGILSTFCQSRSFVTAETEGQRLTNCAPECPYPSGIFPIPGRCSMFQRCENGVLSLQVCPRGLHFNARTNTCDWPTSARCDMTVEPTTEVKTERSHKSQEISYRGRFADYKPDHVAPTTEVKTDRSHKSQEVSYRGRFAIYTPVHVESTTEVKQERSHKSQENIYSRRFPYYLHTQVETTTEVKRDRSHEAEHIPYHGHFANKVYVQMEKLTNVNQEDSLKEDRLYDVPVDNDQVADSIKVQYLVMSFNETGQEDLVRSVKGQEKHTRHQKQSTISNEIQPSNVSCKEPNGYFQFPGVCSYYLMCLDGTPFLKKCPGDLEFNEDTKQCDIVTKDHCMTYCPMENGIFPVDNHCDLYMRCTNGQLLVKRCPRGLHFNSLFKNCDLPENAKCIFPCPYPSGLFPIPGKCNKFLRCENGEATILTCAQGLHFNARTRTCDWPPSAHCEISCPESDGYYPVQGACNAYVVCSEGRPTLKKCPYGKHFNLEAKRCDLPEFANCEFVCPGNDGLYSYRGHCDSYYHCENGRPALQC